MSFLFKAHCTKL